MAAHTLVLRTGYERTRLENLVGVPLTVATGVVHAVMPESGLSLCGVPVLRPIGAARHEWRSFVADRCEACRRVAGL